MADGTFVVFRVAGIFASRCVSGDVSRFVTGCGNHYFFISEKICAFPV